MPHQDPADEAKARSRRDRRSRVRVLVADDQPLYREAVARAIKARPDLELVGALADPQQLLAELATLRPDVAVVDPTIPGLDAAALLGSAGEQTRVLLLSANPDPAAVYRSLADGAAAFLSKDADAREVCDAVAAVARGDAVLSPALQPALASQIRMRSQDSQPILSQRERQVLGLIAAGHSAPEIGRRLHLSTATVKTHLQHLYEKLGVSERAAAVAEAMRRGLFE